jgi:hypothetical protein
MEIFGLPIDGNWVDDCSFVMAGVWAVARYVRQRGASQSVRSVRRAHVRGRMRWRKPVARRRFFGKATATDVANGVSIFPLCILAASVFSDWLLNALLLANRLILSVAGVAALFGILEDFYLDRR